MEKEGRQKLLEARKSLEKNLSQVVGATSKLLAPLKELSEEQRDAVVMLGLLVDVMSLAKRPTARLSEGVMMQFKEQVDGICPPLGEVAIATDPCMDSTTSYLSALKKCDDEGKSEDECPDSWGHGAAAVMCTMEKIETAKREIEVLLRRHEPPKPIPWPY